MTNCSKKVSMKWTSHLAQRWTKIPGAQHPPYAPELNAMEQVWEWIKNHFLSNQFYGVYEDIVTIACYAWNKLAQILS